MTLTQDKAIKAVDFMLKHGLNISQTKRQFEISKHSIRRELSKRGLLQNYSKNAIEIYGDSWNLNSINLKKNNKVVKLELNSATNRVKKMEELRDIIN